VRTQPFAKPESQKREKNPEALLSALANQLLKQCFLA